MEKAGRSHSSSHDDDWGGHDEEVKKRERVREKEGDGEKGKREREARRLAWAAGRGAVRRPGTYNVA